MLEVDGAGLVADGLDEGGQAEVAGPAQEAFGGPYDKGKRVEGEDVVGQSGGIELVEDEAFDGFLLPIKLPPYAVTEDYR